jgi:hypothetical protein
VRARTVLVAVALALPAMLVAPLARAMGAIVSSPDGSSSIAGVHMALAATPTRTTRWVSLDVHGSATAFAWILPVLPTGYVDAATDAWLEALEEASAPRVVPPASPAGCALESTVDDQEEPIVLNTVPASSVAIAPDATTLSSALAAWGMTMPGPLASAVATAAANGDGFVALYYPQTAVDVRTHTVRVVDTSASSLPLGWLPASGPVNVTAYALLAGGATVPGGASLLVDPASVLWAQDGSTYGEVTSSQLLSSPGAWLFDTRATGPVFGSTTLPDGTTIRPLASDYFAKAASDGDATGDPVTCTAAASGWSTSSAPVALACPAGALAHLGAGTCTETTVPGEIGPGAFRCGGIADDLALALSGISPSGAWITRMRTVLSTGTDTTVLPSTAATAIGPVVESAGYEPGICPPAADAGEPPTGSNADAGTGDDGGLAPLGPEISGIGPPSSSGCDGSCQGVTLIEMSVAGRRRTEAAGTASLVVLSLAVARRRRRRA